MGKRAPSPIDLEIGQRIRLHRVCAGLTQATLGNALGLTFQQIQKYEKGTNRVGASRLSQIATALNVPLAAFFDGATGGKKTSLVTASLIHPQGMRLLKAFAAIGNKRVRASLLKLVDILAHPAPRLARGKSAGERVPARRAKRIRR